MESFFPPASLLKPAALFAPIPETAERMLEFFNQYNNLRFAVLAVWRPGELVLILVIPVEFPEFHIQLMEIAVCHRILEVGIAYVVDPSGYQR